MKKLTSVLWISGCILLSIAGFVLFYILYAPDFNMYWFILSPIIIALYQFPAVALYWLYKKKKNQK
ncbi:MAG: hypothetical protein JXB26_01475 [Candidatus Aminicenantes bacterium]|nr:hypothetical protein [Candidatus Aminicenantes bacterium]